MALLTVQKHRQRQQVDLQPAGATIAVTIPSDNPFENRNPVSVFTQAGTHSAAAPVAWRSRRIFTTAKDQQKTLRLGQPGSVRRVRGSAGSMGGFTGGQMMPGMGNFPGMAAEMMPGMGAEMMPGMGAEMMPGMGSQMMPGMGFDITSVVGTVGQVLGQKYDAKTAQANASLAASQASAASARAAADAEQARLNQLSAQSASRAATVKYVTYGLLGTAALLLGGAFLLSRRKK